jgi:pyruvate/2-oxoglutarate dehydrogenase complex dihydrolipoamide dehydrogenase (E3) component
LIRTGEVAQLARRGQEFGVEIDGTVRVNLAAAVARKDRIVRGIIDGIYAELKKNARVTFFKGHAGFVTGNEIEVNGDRLRADKFIIATGADDPSPPIAGLSDAGFLTNYEALQLTTLPRSLVVIGGGYVGLEFAQMFARFGSAVTLLQRNVRLAPHEEPEISEKLAEVLREEGIRVFTHTPVLRVERDDASSRRFESATPFRSMRDDASEGTEKIVVAQVNGREEKFRASEILVAAGRKPNVAELNLDVVGIEMDTRAIRVNAQLQTTAQHVYAIGDVIGGHMFTHKATYDGPLAALNAVKGLNRSVDYRVVPRAIFTDPTVASVGLTEREAREQGYRVAVGTFPFAWSGRAKAMGETKGLVKIVADAKTNEILGGHILGPHADILIHEIAVAMYNHGTLDTITKTIHIHPTLSEAVKSAAKGVREIVKPDT